MDFHSAVCPWRRRANNAPKPEDLGSYRSSTFYHRVEQYAGKWHASPSLFLGRERIHQAGLLFTRSEARRVREDIGRHLNAN